MGLLLILLMLSSQDYLARRVVLWWGPTVDKHALVYPVPRARALAHIAWESAGNPTARNPEKNKEDPSDDSVGLFQITQAVVTDFNRATGKKYTLKSMMVAEKNVEVGMWNLWRHYQRYGDWDTASRRHNGSGKATHLYLKKVKEYEHIIQGIGQ